MEYLMNSIFHFNYYLLEWGRKDSTGVMRLRLHVVAPSPC
jgi:hypothetical protein